MARRRLTLSEQLRGVSAALRSKGTPPQLKEGLQRQKEFLEKALGTNRDSKSAKKKSRF